MFLRIQISISITRLWAGKMDSNYNKRIDLAKEKIKEADFLLIGAGSGLSTAAGLDYSGERFRKNFSDYEENYGITDMYSGMFYHFDTPEETWAYRARHIDLNRFEMGATKLYKDLLKLIDDKKHFVLTTNVDHQFYLSGFKTQNIFPTQGDYAKFQCSEACHDLLYDNISQIKKMRESTSNFKVPNKLVPICPRCGEPMSIHVRIDENFIENSEYRSNYMRYQNFITEIKNKNAVLLELGVGFNTPSIIKYPFERLTYNNSDYSLIRLNKYNPQGSDENKKKTITFREDVDKIISDLLV